MHVTQSTWPKTLPPLMAADKPLLPLLDDKSTFNNMGRYADSKLALAAFVHELAKIAPSEVIVNHLCPGLVQTGFDKDLPFFLKTFMILFRKTYGRTLEEGGRTLVHASAIAGPETNGKFVQHCAPAE